MTKFYNAKTGEEVTLLVPDLCPKGSRGWSDQLLIEETKEIRIENVWETNNLIKKILTRFWNFYITGKSQNDDNSFDIIGSAVLLSLDPNSSEGNVKFMFKDLVQISDDDSRESDIKVGNFLPDDEEYDWTYGEKINGYSIYSNVRYLNFSRHVKDTLSNWKLMQTIPQNIIDLMKLTSVVSMMTFRAVVKEQRHMEKTFIDKTLFDNIKTMMKFSDDILFAPPCKQFVEKISKIMNRSHAFFRSTSKNLRMILITRYTIEKRLGDQGNESIIKLLIFSCLKECAFNGIPVIKYLYTCCDHLGVSIEGFFSLISRNNCRSEEAIINFCNESLKKTNYQYSAHWCRFLMDHYYTDLRFNDLLHHRTAAFMGGIIEAAENNPGIWNTAWGKQAKSFTHIADFGKEVYKNLDKIDKQTTSDSEYLILMP